MARVVVPGLPHHVTARGNRRVPIFFEDDDHDIYADILAEETRRASVEVWAYCLMPTTDTCSRAATPRRPWTKPTGCRRSAMSA